MNQERVTEGRRLGLGALIGIWMVVFLGTAAFAVFQRRTGPTYPVSVKTNLAGAEVSGQLPRSHAGEGGPTISVKAGDPSVQGAVIWRRYPSEDTLSELPMKEQAGSLEATLPHFPSAAKVAYTVRLKKGDQTTSVPEKPAVLRYRGDVPALLLIAHVLLMFFGLLIGFRVAAAALLNEPNPRYWFRLLVPALLLGGFVLGPMMSWYSFGEIWTGWPLGPDLTDSKTLGTMLVWLAAWWVSARKPGLCRASIIVAFVVMVAVYLIPHSLGGSELDWSKANANAALESSSP
jgi:hypothetical protein